MIRLDARLQHAGMTTWEGVAGFVFWSLFGRIRNSNICFYKTQKQNIIRSEHNSLPELINYQT